MSEPIEDSDDRVVQEKINVIKEIVGRGEENEKEFIGREELVKLFRQVANGERRELIAYDGFEPSGRMHIAQGVMRALNVNRLTQTGVKFVFLVADWHAKLNQKLGGDMDKIRRTGQYFVEIWRALGMDLNNVTFKFASDLINDDPQKYWGMVMTLAQLTSQARVNRCAPIMGRKESDESATVSQLLYPCMQVVDIFCLNVDICQLGLDQRKVNMWAREVAEKKKRKKAKGNVRKELEKFGVRVEKPVVLSHPMLMGLKEGQAKMSKSDPDSAIFMDDTVKAVQKKVKKAFCPEREVDNNPVLNYCEHIIFPAMGELRLERPEEYGGNVSFGSYETLVEAFAAGNVHPGDLKKAVAAAINKLLQPVRDHFDSSDELKKLLKDVQGYRVTK